VKPATEPPIIFFPGERIYLRPIEPTDAKRYQRWTNDPSTWTNMLGYRPITEEAERQALQQYTTDPNATSFAIVVREGDIHIGGLALHQIHPRNRSAHFGIMIGEPSYRGQGYGTEATRLMLKYAFETLNLHRVELGVYATNVTGIRVYENCGFVREGVQREHTFIAGRYVDHIYYSMLDREYFARYGQPAPPAS
jgi:RimJ/RimL family protein N-acetyltransferase